MAVNYTFDTNYSQQYGEASASLSKKKYRILIGHVSDEDIATGGQLDLMSPGMTLDWGGDADKFMAAFMGSTLSFTALLNDAQLAIWEELLDLNEGQVFAFFFDSWSTSAIPYWYGHLVIESTTITISNERHLIDLEFTDGLAQLRGAPWKDSGGNEYQGFQPLRYYLLEIIRKLPARAAFEYYVLTTLSNAYAPLVSEIGFPDPRINGDANTEFHHGDSKLYYLRVRGETFLKPKKQVDRLRVIPARPDYFDTGSVLEDICKAFGATACMFDGYINIMCRHDVATMHGANIAWHKHTYNPAQGTPYQVLSNISSGSFIAGMENDYLIEDADDRFEVLNGAVKRRSLPIYQVNLTHEEGGSDWLVCGGYFLDSTISHIDLAAAAAYVPRASQISSGLLQPYQSSLFAEVDGNRRDLWFQFLYRTPSTVAGSPGITDSGFPTDPAGQDSVDLPFFEFPADITGYIGYPARTVNDLEFQSDEPVKIEFSDTIKFTREKTLSYGAESSAFREFHVGKTLIMRMRIQFTTTSGVVYRLRRVVTTHINTNGSPDGINIKGQGLGYWHFTGGEVVFQFGSDRTYYRKVYESIDWVKTGDSDFDDAWVEWLVPDGETAKAEDGWGTDTYENYDAQYGLYQPDYAPIGCALDNEEGEEGQGVEYKKGGDATFIQYFSDNITVQLPFADDGSVLDFESAFFEQGYEYWYHHEGPRANNGQTYTPIWRTAEHGGTGSRRHNGAGSWRTLPEYIHCEAIRLTIGNGEETQDFVTKIQGGDGYEIHNIGSSRIGSRLSFSNTHIGGTLWARTKNTSDDGDFDFANQDYSETLQWRGHCAGDVQYSYVPAIAYDSLHSYVCNGFIDLFGESRVVYDMTLIPRQDSTEGSLVHPFHVMAIKKLVQDKSFTEYIMPLSYKWTLDEGVQGSFLKVHQTRERSTAFSIPTPDFWGAGGMTPGGPGGVMPGKNVMSRFRKQTIKMHKISIANNIDLDDARDDINTNTANVSFVQQKQEEEEINNILTKRPTTGLTSTTGGTINVGTTRD